MGLDIPNFQWVTPWALWLFLAFIPLLLRDFRKKEQRYIPMPSLRGMEGSSSVIWLQRFLKFTKYLILTAAIIALARPRTFTVSQDPDERQGIDIFLSVDVSLSMLARDLEPDRLTALKSIAMRFVDRRVNDRIGLVIYSGEAVTKVPLTTDHRVVTEELENLNPLELESGTAIGEGLSTAVNHLKDSKAKSKIIILMTDGVNTIQNAMDPQTAALLAKDFNIKVYTIGIGTNGVALMPTQIDPFGQLVFTENEVQIDEATLFSIAQATGGKYFRATSNQSLEKIYDEIDRLEKSEVNSAQHYAYTEYFRYFLFLALAVLMLDILLRFTIIKTLV